MEDERWRGYFADAETVADVLLCAQSGIVSRAADVVSRQPIFKAETLADVVVAAAKLFVAYNFSPNDAQVVVCNVRDFVAETLHSQGAKNHVTFVQCVHESALGRPHDVLPADRTHVYQGIIIGLAMAGFAHFCKVLTKSDQHAKRVVSVVVSILTSPVNAIPIAGTWATQAINTGVAVSVGRLMPERDFLPDIDRVGAQSIYNHARATGVAKCDAEIHGAWTDAMMAFARAA